MSRTKLKIGEMPAKGAAFHMRGWVILHPRRENNKHLRRGDPSRTVSEPSVETCYFHVKRWNARKSSHPDSRVRHTREEWRRIYRPDCRMVRATLIIPPA